MGWQTEAHFEVNDKSYNKNGTEKMEDCYNRDINMCLNLCHSCPHAEEKNLSLGLSLYTKCT